MLSVVIVCQNRAVTLVGGVFFGHSDKQFFQDGDDLPASLFHLESATHLFHHVTERDTLPS